MIIREKYRDIIDVDYRRLSLFRNLEKSLVRHNKTLDVLLGTVTRCVEYIYIYFIFLQSRQIEYYKTFVLQKSDDQRPCKRVRSP